MRQSDGSTSRGSAICVFCGSGQAAEYMAQFRADNIVKDAEAAWAAEGDKAAWADLSDFINPQKTDKAVAETGWAARGMANQWESRRRHYTADGGSF